MKPTIEIYVATQKMIVNLDSALYQPIQVGCSLGNGIAELPYLKDNTLENISFKNASYCELTALYWAWKNSKADIIGLMHYRRYLTLKKHPASLSDVLGEKDIQSFLMDCDIILPYKDKIFGTVEEQYKTNANIEDFNKVKLIIEKKYPDYLDAFLTVSKADKIYTCNIFIAKKEIMDSYCFWVFDILKELEKEINIQSYSKSQKRVYGYLAERLLNVWVLHERIKVKEVYLYNTEEKVSDRLRNAFHSFEYYGLHIDYLKYSYNRRLKREKKAEKISDEDKIS